MSNGWSPQDILLSQKASVPASQSAYELGKPFKITAGGALRMVIAAQASAVGGAGPVFKLQTSSDGTTWSDVKSSAALGAPGEAYIRVLVDAAADQSVLPMLSMGRVVAVTGVGDTATLDWVRVLQAK